MTIRFNSVETAKNMLADLSALLGDSPMPESRANVIGTFRVNWNATMKAIEHLSKGGADAYGNSLHDLLKAMIK